MSRPATEVRRRRLPLWLSWPVVLSAPLVLVLIGVQVVSEPEAIPLAIVPLAIVAPALLWLDRVHPQRWSTRVHALLWGATISVLVAGILNSAAGSALSPTLEAVLAAPVVEEAMKGLGVVWAVRRGEIDGPMDGILTAGWVALGFTVVEDMAYFAQSAQDGELLESFLLRGLLTPFAHPMLTFWTGLAIGMAVFRQRSVVWAAWGFGIAVATHVLFNGVWELADERFPPLGIALFATMLVVVGMLALRVRSREVDQFITAVPALAERYGLSQAAVAAFDSWRGTLSHRRSLPRDQRRQFDDLRGALARLALQQARPGGPDPDREQVLVEQLRQSVSDGLGGALPHA
jgi:RsiW-degrading membrane proteinase PrsW (M82 family)